MPSVHRLTEPGRHANRGRHRKHRRRVLGLPIARVVGAVGALALVGGGVVAANAAASDHPAAVVARTGQVQAAAQTLQARHQQEARAAARARSDRSAQRQQAAYERARSAWEASQAAQQIKLEKSAAQAVGDPSPIPIDQPAAPAGAVTVDVGHGLTGKTLTYVLPVDSGVTHDTFGMTGPYWVARHTGQDFPVGMGTRVKSVSSGTVLETAWAGPYGNRIRILLDDGTEIWYCHLSRFIASTGQRVSAGQVVARSGSTGNSTGPHMHMEVHPNQQKTAIDPLDWLRSKGLKI